MQGQGSIAITARGDSSRWYGRISVPHSLAAEVGLTAGMRIGTRCHDGHILIFPDDGGRIRFPGTTGKNNPRHAFEAATSTLGLKEIAFPQSGVHMFVKQGIVHVKIPDQCVSTESKARKKVKKEEAKTPSVSSKPPAIPLRGVYGASAAVLIEANRAGKKVRPMNQQQIVDLLKELGHDVKQLGPRLYNFQNRSSSISDLLEAANRLTSGDGKGTIILEMQ